MLQGKTALVTGSTSGIGLGIAKALAKQGANIVLNGFGDASEIAKLCEELAATSGGRAIFAAGDLTKREGTEAMVATALAEFGAVDILINNAGMPDAQRAHKMSLDLIDNVLGVNLRGPWILSCEVARRLIAAGKPGRMVNISSVAHFRYDGSGAALYAVTKTAIARMTEALAVEWAPKVRVVAVSPGLVQTEQSHLHYGDEAGIAAVGATIPAGRMATPDDIANACLYAGSPMAAYFAGTNLLLHGGGERPAFLAAGNAAPAG